MNPSEGEQCETRPFFVQSYRTIVRFFLEWPSLSVDVLLGLMFSLMEDLNLRIYKIWIWRWIEHTRWCLALPWQFIGFPQSNYGSHIPGCPDIKQVRKFYRHGHCHSKRDVSVPAYFFCVCGGEGMMAVFETLLTMDRCNLRSSGNLVIPAQPAEIRLTTYHRLSLPLHLE